MVQIADFGSTLASLVSAVSSSINGHFDRKHDDELERRRQRFELQMVNLKEEWQKASAREENDRISERTLVEFTRTREMHLELRSLDHRFRIEEQSRHFEMLKASSDYEYFRTHAWPLREPPTGLPEIVSGDQAELGIVPVRVIITDSNSQRYADGIGRDIARELRTYCLAHHEHNGPHGAVFYSGGWKSDHRGQQGGAYIAALYAALQGQPTVVIEPEVDSSERKLVLRVSFWGLGIGKGYVTRDILETELAANGANPQGVVNNPLLAAHQLCVSLLTDAYHFLEYNTPPALPSILRSYPEGTVDPRSLDFIASIYGQLFKSWLARPEAWLMDEEAIAFLEQLSGLGDASWASRYLAGLFARWLRHHRLSESQDLRPDLVLPALQRADGPTLMRMVTIARSAAIESDSALFKLWDSWCKLFLLDEI